MPNLIKLILPYIVFLQLIECQYISRGANYFHNPYKSGLRYVPPNRFNTIHDNNRYVYRSIDNDFKNNMNINNRNNNNEYENPVTVQYYYKHKPLEERWKETRPPPPPIHPIPPPMHHIPPPIPVHKPESFVVDYSEDEYTEQVPQEKHLDSFHSGVNYDTNDEHNEKDFKEAGKKQLEI